MSVTRKDLVAVAAAEIESSLRDRCHAAQVRVSEAWNQLRTWVEAAVRIKKEEHLAWIADLTGVEPDNLRIGIPNPPDDSRIEITISDFETYLATLTWRTSIHLDALPELRATAGELTSALTAADRAEAALRAAKEREPTAKAKAIADALAELPEGQEVLASLKRFNAAFREQKQ